MGKANTLDSSLSKDCKEQTISEWDSFLLELKDACRIIEQEKNEIQAENYSLEQQINKQDTLLKTEQAEDSEFQIHLKALREQEESSRKRYEQARKASNIHQYEFQRIKSIYDDMKKQAYDIVSLNEDIVHPVLEKRRVEYEMVKEEVKCASDELAKSLKTLSDLNLQLNETKESYNDLQQTLQDKRGIELRIRGEPQEIDKVIDVIKKKIIHTHSEVKSSENALEISKSKLDEETKNLQKHKKELKDWQRKVQDQEAVYEEYENKYSSVLKMLTIARAQHDSITTARSQINVTTREASERARREASKLSIERKQLERMMRLYLKKKLIVDKLQDVVQELTDRLKTCNDAMIQSEHELEKRNEENELARDEINIMVTRLLQQKSVEDEIKIQLETILRRVEERENDIDRLRTEVKKQSKIASVLQNHRDIQVQKTVNILNDIKETEEILNLKEYILAEMEKSLSETNGREKELGVLLETLLKKKRELTVSLTTATRNVFKTKEEIETQVMEMQQLRSLHEEKHGILLKERDLHDGRKGNNAVLRVDKSQANDCFRSKQNEEYSLTIQLKKMSSVLSGLQRNSSQLRSKNRHMSKKIQMMTNQLDDKRLEIHSLLKRSNLLDETQKRGELATSQKQEDLRALKIQCADIERHIMSKRSSQSDFTFYEEKIKSLENELKVEINQQLSMSKCLEDPDKNESWRELGGEDLDDVQLQAKIKILEDRLDNNRAQIIEREVLLEELNSQIEDMNKQTQTRSIKVQPVMKKLNDLQGRMRDVTRSMMALVSELSMYQANVLNLEDEKVALSDALRISQNLINDGQPSSQPAICNEERQNQEEDQMKYSCDHVGRDLPHRLRPNAYIIEGEETPKPFGVTGAFQPPSTIPCTKYQRREKDFVSEGLLVA